MMESIPLFAFTKPEPPSKYTIDLTKMPAKQRRYWENTRFFAYNVHKCNLEEFMNTDCSHKLYGHLNSVAIIHWISLFKQISIQNPGIQICSLHFYCDDEKTAYCLKWDCFDEFHKSRLLLCRGYSCSKHYFVDRKAWWCCGTSELRFDKSAYLKKWQSMGVLYPEWLSPVSDS